MKRTQQASSAARIGGAAAIGMTTVVAFGATASGQDDDDLPRCIDVIGDPRWDDSDDWSIEEWEEFIWGDEVGYHPGWEGCTADFGDGKLIVDVVTQDGSPVPSTVDLAALVHSFDFGFVDPVRDANRARFDPYCQKLWEQPGQFGEFSRSLLEFFVMISDYDDFRMDDTVAGRRVRVLQLLGDRDLSPPGNGAQDLELKPNQMIFSWACFAEFDRLRMVPPQPPAPGSGLELASSSSTQNLGGGYELVLGVNPSFVGFEPFGTTQFEVRVRQASTTTTSSSSTTSSTTTSTTTTSVPGGAAPTTAPGATPTSGPPAEEVAAPPGPDTTEPVMVLPSTGRATGPTAAIAALFAALGGLALFGSRRRPTSVR